MSEQSVKISVELSDDEAYALAQLCKRVHVDSLADVAGDQDEAGLMYWALVRIREALRLKGYAPR